MSNYEQGSSLIEIIISLSLGLMLIAAVLYALAVAMQFAIRQKENAYVYRNYGDIEAQMRGAISFASTELDCPGSARPSFENAILSAGLSADIKYLLQKPVQIYPGNEHTVISRENNLQTRTVEGLAVSGRWSVSNVAQDSDVVYVAGIMAVLIERENEQFTISEDQFSFVKEKLVVLLTDCQQIYIVPFHKTGLGTYALAAEDAVEAARLFPQNVSVFAYQIYEFLFYVQASEGQISFVQNYLDGSTFFRVSDVLVFRVWEYRDADHSWQRWQDIQSKDLVALLGFQFILQSEHNSDRTQITLPSSLLFGSHIGPVITVLNPRQSVLNLFFAIHRYNF